MIHTSRSGERRGLAIASGAAIVGLLIVLMSQLDDAPFAYADDASSVLADIQGVEALGQTDLSDAATAFAGGSTVQGLADAFAGVDDLTESPGQWLLLGGSDELTGTVLPASNWFDFDDTLITTTSWSDAVTDASTLAAMGDTFATAASAAYNGGDVSTALSDLLIAGDFIGIMDPQELALGLASSF